MWDFNHQRDLNKVICVMQMGKVAIGDFKTIQLCMDAADRQLMNVHMGKTFSVGWLNDEVCGKSNFVNEKNSICFVRNISQING